MKLLTIAVVVACSVALCAQSSLTPDQKKAALRRMNSDKCDCGCRLTLAQCRINDTSCEISRKLAANVVKQIASTTPSSVPEKTAATPE